MDNARRPPERLEKQTSDTVLSPQTDSEAEFVGWMYFDLILRF